MHLFQKHGQLEICDLINKDPDGKPDDNNFVQQICQNSCAEKTAEKSKNKKYGRLNEQKSQYIFFEIEALLVCFVSKIKHFLVGLNMYLIHH